MRNDAYHPHYSSIDKDYTERLMRFAMYLQRAKELGIHFLAFNKEHKELVGWKDDGKWVRV